MIIRVFFSWQTETDPMVERRSSAGSRKAKNSMGWKGPGLWKRTMMGLGLATPEFHNKRFLIECIQAAFKEIEGKREFKDCKFQLVEGTRELSGHPSLAAKMFSQADDCDVFIADYTITQPSLKGLMSILPKSLRSRPGVNANVIDEYGRFVGKYPEREEQTVLLMNDVYGSPKDNPEIFHFDERDKRWPIIFTLKDDNLETIKAVRRELMKELPEAICRATRTAIQNKHRRIEPFCGWKKHSMENPFSGKFIWIPVREESRELVRDDSKKYLRILGLSGLGKTRIVLESFRNHPAADRYLYVDCSLHEKSLIAGTLKSEVFTHYPEAIIVLDNCSMQDFRDYINIRKSACVECRFISLYNDPNENAEQGVEQVKIERNLDEVVAQMLELRNITGQDAVFAKKFAGGIPMMAELLAEGINDGLPRGIVNHEVLMSKILGIDRGSDSRTILQSISLFDYIGWRDELRPEIEFVAKNKAITSIEFGDEVLMNKVDEVVLGFMRRNIIETRGRRIGLRPMPLAIYLILEWMESCSADRMKRFISDLSDSPHAFTLSNALYNNLRYVGFNDTARQLLSSVVSTSGPFASAEVVDSKVGSMLLRTFAEIVPSEVSGLLMTVLGNMTLEELHGFDRGRRNIVWLLEKLCFADEFFDDSAYLMMRLGIAENEWISNNAHNQFTRYFKLLLPATSVSTSRRLDFLRKHSQNPENVDIILDAIAQALSTANFFFMSGPETLGMVKKKNYTPTLDEMHEYIRGVAELLLDLYEKDGQPGFEGCRRRGKEILVANVGVLCDASFGDLILPIIGHVAELSSYDWDEMWDAMSLFKSRLLPNLSSNSRNLYTDILGKLEKQDIVSRFRRVEKYYDLSSDRFKGSFEKHIEAQRECYAEIARDFLFKEGYSKETLHDLMSIHPSFSNPFGNTMAKEADCDLRGRILADMTEILNDDPSASYQIAEDFISELGDDEFDKRFDLIKYIDRADLMFSVVGRRGLSATKYIDYLFSLAGHSVEASKFVRFFNSLDIRKIEVEKLISFLRRLSNVNGGVDAIISIGTNLFMFGNRPGKEVANFLSNLMISMLRAEYGTDDSVIADCDDFKRCMISLLSFDSIEQGNELAACVTIALLKRIDKIEETIISDYDLEELFSVLIDRYFDAVWPEISKALSKSSDDSIIYYKISQILYSSYHQMPCFDISLHKDELKQWCIDNPKIAPQRLMMIIPWSGGNGFSSMAQFLIDNFGDNEDMLDILGSKMGTIAGSGSLIPDYESRREVVAQLKHHPNANVRRWADQQVRIYDADIKRIADFEAEFSR